MRTIDTDGLTCLGPDGFGPYRLGDDRLLRTSQALVPFETKAEAQAVFDTYRAARRAGAPTPDALELVRVPNGFGVVVEYVAGLPLGTHIMFGSYSTEEAGRAMGTLARKLHKYRMEAGHDWRARFERRARKLSAWLSPESVERLTSLLEAVPPATTLIHGDLHVANVLVLEDECQPIDMESAGFGHPMFELAIARSRLASAAINLNTNIGVERNVSERVWREIWRAFLKSYFDGASETELESLDQRFELLAEVELLRQLCSNRQDNTELMSENERKRLASRIRRIEELLPRLSRLDF